MPAFLWLCPSNNVVAYIHPVWYAVTLDNILLDYINKINHTQFFVMVSQIRPLHQATADILPYVYFWLHLLEDRLSKAYDVTIQIYNE